jgi:hypothetical protein
MNTNMRFFAVPAGLTPKAGIGLHRLGVYSCPFVDDRVFQD